MPLKNKIADLTDAEFDLAEAYFRDHPRQQKMPRPKKEGDYGWGVLKHSFLNVPDKNGAFTVYAQAAGSYLGKGGSANVKTVQARNGNNYISRTVGITDEAPDPEGMVITDTLGRLHGVSQREYSGNKPWRVDPQTGEEQRIREKQVTIEDYLEGTPANKMLFKKNARDPNARGKKKTEAELDAAGFGLTQRMIFAAKALRQVDMLHQKRIIHKDLKPESFMVDISPQGMKVKLFDFDASQKLEANQRVAEGGAVGTDYYPAPEIIEDKPVDAEFSFASDIYAMGQMLIKDLGIQDPLVNKMIDPNPLKRPMPDEVHERLATLIRERPDKQNANPADLQKISTYELVRTPREKAKLKTELQDLAGERISLAEKEQQWPITQNQFKAATQRVENSAKEIDALKEQRKVLQDSQQPTRGIDQTIAQKEQELATKKAGLARGEAQMNAIIDYQRAFIPARQESINKREDAIHKRINKLEAQAEAQLIQAPAAGVGQAVLIARPARHPAPVPAVPPVAPQANPEAPAARGDRSGVGGVEREPPPREPRGRRGGR